LLSHRKCAKFVEGKKSAMGDKAPVKPEKFLVLDLRKNALLVGDALPTTLTHEESARYGQEFSNLLENDSSVLAKGQSDEEDEEEG
jgi:hypothetical protein